MAEQRHPPWVDDLKQNGRSFWHKHDECIGGSAGISTGGLKPWSTISHLHQGKKRRLPAQRVRDSLERSVNKYRAHGSWLFIGGTTCKERRLSYSCWALSCYRAWKCFLQVSQFHSVEFRLITSHEGRDMDSALSEGTWSSYLADHVFSSGGISFHLGSQRRE